MENFNYSFRVVRESKLLGVRFPVTDWFSDFSEANSACLVFSERYEDLKTFYFLVECKIEKS